MQTWHDTRTCRIGKLGKNIQKLSASVGIGMLRCISKGKFTTDDALLWSGIPVEIQKHILKNAFCAKCNILVEIVNYTGVVENGDLIFDGDCAVCGHAAARVVETSQASHENN